MIDILLILLTKLVFIVGFLFLIKFLINKIDNIIPEVIYWIFGIVFTFMIPSSIFDWIFQELFLYEQRSSGPLSAICSIVLYIYLGVKVNKLRTAKKKK